MKLTVEIHIADADVESGWEGNERELARSIDAALFELQGDDGMAYRVHTTSVETPDASFMFAAGVCIRHPA